MAIRRPVIAGNWKMHHGPEAAGDFFRDFLDAAPVRDDRSIVFFPPAASLAAAANATRARPDITIGAQNVHWESKGAFTGEMSTAIAVEAGARMALVGHSERRHVFGETDAETAQKVEACLSADLVPVLCVGETLDEREAGSASDVVRRQLAAVLDVLPEGAANRLIIAYEPVWAIGTGRTASPTDASEMHRGIRDFLIERVGEATASAVPILYGGSVKPDNAAELLCSDGIDGVLVGGASLDPADFARICAASG